MPRTRRRTLSSLALALAIVAGLALTVPFAAPATVEAAPPAAAQPSPVTTGVPRFEPAPCVYRFPQDQQEGRTVTCGFAVLPERHERPDGRTIRLPVAVYRAIAPAPNAEPIILLAGGPGQDSQVFANALTGANYQALAATNDVVFFDQRGTGRAQPSLACTELGTTAMQQMLAFAVEALQSQPSFIDRVRQCRDRLVGQGVDLAAYTTTQNAADVNAVRAVLGYSRANLVGASYGSELGLAVERDFGQFVRAAGLVSIIPLQVPWYARQAVSFDRTLNEYYRACAADAACRAAYPDLRATFRQTVARLNEAPVAVPITDPETGQAINARLNGTTFTSLLFQLAYSTQLVPLLPDLIGKVGQGDTAFLGRLLSGMPSDPGTQGSVSVGFNYSVICTSDTSTDLLRRTIESFDTVQPEVAEALGLRDILYFAVCEEWPSKGADPITDTPVTSDVPTLLLNGQFDPITPPDYGAVAAETLSRDFNVLLPGAAHSAILGRDPVSQCGTTIALTFLANPERGPDTSCTAGVGFRFERLPAAGQPGQPTPTAVPGTATRTPATTATRTPATPAATPTRPAATPATTPTVRPTTPTPTVPIPGMPNTGTGASAGGVGDPATTALFLAALGLCVASGAALVRRRRA